MIKFENIDPIYLKGIIRFFVNMIPILILILIVLMMTFNGSYADQTPIPIWIKNTTKWWSEGQIGDSDFIKCIQYLVQQQIIKIPPTSSSSNTVAQIPIWVKNNAGWWANGTISDSDFIKGIQYLIQVNIINVNLQQSFFISSPAFDNNGTIPSQYTCDGKNISPPLTITGVPTNAKSLALVLDDVDAPRGIFTHWIVWNIPTSTLNFSAGENITFPQGTTSAGTMGYHGLCPPSGQIHRYYFKLYALDSLLNLDAGATKSDLENSMNGHMISQTTLLGKYSR